MKIALVLAVASLGLAGCGSVDFFGDSGSAQVQSAPIPDTSQTVAAAPAPAASPAQPSSQMASTQADTTDMSAAPASTASYAPVAQAAASPSAHCTTLAKQRAQDAAFQGEDPDTQESVYNRTYSDCVAWDLKHRL